jgi:hypothetical protein
MPDGRDFGSTTEATGYRGLGRGIGWVRGPATVPRCARPRHAPAVWEFTDVETASAAPQCGGALVVAGTPRLVTKSVFGG